MIKPLISFALTVIVIILLSAFCHITGLDFTHAVALVALSVGINALIEAMVKD